MPSQWLVDGSSFSLESTREQPILSTTIAQMMLGSVDEGIIFLLSGTLEFFG
jgi:hypothetical protein